MRFIHAYLIGYFVLVCGAGLVLFQAGVLSRSNPLWVFASAAFVVGIGVLLAVTAGKPPVAQD